MNKEPYFREVINAALQEAANNGLSYCIASWDDEDGGREIYLIRTDGQMIHAGECNCTGHVDDVPLMFDDIAKFIEPYTEGGKLILDEYWDDLGPSFAPTIDQFYNGTISFDEIFEASIQFASERKKPSP